MARADVDTLSHSGPTLISARDRWLQYLDRQLAESEGVALLKLSLYTETAQSQLTSIKTPTELFHHVCTSNGGDEQLTLAKFHRSLLSLGGKLRGRMCINSAQQQFGLHLPPPFNPKHQSREFKFFQCLTQISKKLKLGEQNGENEVMIHFCHPNHLAINHRNIAGLPDLFVRLYQKRIVTPDNTQKLRDCLTQYDLRDAMRYLNEYCGSEFPPNQDHEDETSESSDPPSAYSNSVTRRRIGTPTSKSHITAAAAKPNHDKTESSNVPLNEDGVTGGKVQEPTELSQSDGGTEGKAQAPTQLSQSDTWPALDQLQRVNSTEENRSSKPTPQKRLHRRCVYCLRILLLILLLSFVLLSVLLVVFSKFLWHPLHDIATAPNPMKTLQQQGYTVVLSEFEQFLVREVKVQEQLIFPIESTHTIDLFLVDSECSSLVNNHVRCHSLLGDITNISNASSYYLMPHSMIYYNICASSNHSKPDPIYVYIIPGLQKDLNFNPNSYNDDLWRKTVEVGNNGNHNCKLLRHSVPHWNYYTVRTIVSNKQLTAWVWYNLTVEERYINDSAIDASKVVSKYTLSQNRDNASFPISFGLKTWCLVADIQVPTVTQLHNYVHTKLYYTLRYEHVIAITALPTFICVLLLVVLASIACCLKRKVLPKMPWMDIVICRCKRGYSYMPM